MTAENRWELMAQAATEVGPALFFSLLIITLSFVPVFTLEAQEGRLFSPLAFTKTYAMAAAAGLSITLVPVLMGYFIRGKIVAEKSNPVNRLLIGAYRPLINWVLQAPKTVLLVGALVAASLFWPIAGWWPLHERWAANSCRRSMKATCCICRPPSRPFPSAKPRNSCSRRTS